jgi:HPt (histidine-containing phosphotransfer) domain-containing protein
VFLADLSVRVRAAGEQVKHDDNAGLAATAHALKGGSSHFGAAPLMQLCAAIEDQVRSKKTAGISASVDSMIAEAERVRLALTTFRFVPPPLDNQLN